MKLRSSTPFWQIKDGLPTSFSPLRENLSCEVLVIGAGISGALIAYQLARAGVNCVIIDKRDPGFGSTSASTSLVMYEVDKALSELIQLRGERDAVKSYKLCLEAISKIEKIVQQLGHDCGFQRKKSLYLSMNSKQTASLRREYTTRRKYGFKVDFLERSEIKANFSFSNDAALVSSNYDDAVMDPVAFTYALLENSSASKLRVFSRTEAVKFQNLKDKILVTTDRDFQVKARKVVFATGYETFHYIKHKVVKLKSTYALVSEPVPKFAGWGFDQCLIWEADRPYFYMRTTEDGRVMLGGKDEDFVNPSKRDKLIPTKTRALLSRARKMFPDMDLRPAYSWAGTFGDTKDSLPYVGEINEMPNAYFALCYGANGTNFSLIGSEIIRDLYLGRKNDAAVIFGFDR